MQTIENKIISRIYGTRRGWAFSQSDFSDLGTRAAIDKSLQRLVARGTIPRVIRGIYDYPEYSKRLNATFGPDIDQVARALARKFRWNIQATGMAALNMLGLSTQIQGRYAYMSDGPNRQYKIDGNELTFVHTAFRDSGFKFRESALLVEGLKVLGTERVTEKTVAKLRSAIPTEFRPKILKDTRTAVAWVRDVILKICQEDA
ncbi:MAG: hypothetical protein E4H15_08695 [Syntrophobacterales bacterium]|nr:MAG: hypothetical protein E4H15_08695 [Syntrophobacterales bacterium]